ncbi:MAG: hypothetical protein LBT03_03095 [Holosporales bacterium]|jgi:tRNA A37 threonylcarbamoyladenosine modification protein TsaB|nr:hypothetical protein [Holosporales bacterium]
MKLSYFIKNKEIHVFTDSGFSNIYYLNVSRETSDKIVPCIKEAIGKRSFDEITNIVYQTGPLTFTTARIIFALGKGITLSNPTIKFTGISSFLTYTTIATSKSITGTIAISTMCGSFYKNSYANGILTNENYSDIHEPIYYEDDEIFQNINLAQIQTEILNSTIALQNQKYICQGINVLYTTSPNYVAKK